MRVLIGCEFSGTVRDAFRKLGHDAWSCDLLPGDPPSPFHLMCDVLELIKGRWDLGIFHPPCTFLCSSGLHWNHRRPGRAKQTEQALEFVEALLNADIKRIALENPRGCISTRIRPPDQVIQPYEFGDDASKATCLWLKGLPKLAVDPARFVKPRMVCSICRRNYKYGEADYCGCGSTKLLVPRWANQTDSGQNKPTPSEDRWAKRSITYQGIADAFAAQWGGHT